MKYNIKRIERAERILNALIILILSGVLLAGFVYQLVMHENPCSLCLLQRLGMIGVASALAMNLRFGVKAWHYALALFSIITGAAVALRQIALHISIGFPKFGTPVWGLSLYTWSFIVFVCCLVGLVILLLIYHPEHKSAKEIHLSKLEVAAIASIFVMALLNIVSTYYICGLGPCER